MDSSSIVLPLILLILLGLSAYFSATETAFLSFNRIRMKNLAQDGDKRAAAVLALADNWDKLISTVLIGNNIVNIALSSIATVLFIELFMDAGATIATIVTTVAVLIFGEISPKTIAKDHADGFVLANVYMTRAIMVILTPLNLFFSAWRALLNKVFKKSDEAAITEEELITIVSEAEKDGGIDASESDLILSAIEFNDVCAGDILTPRVDVCAVSVKTDIDETIQILLDNGFSRIPVYGEDMDDIVGILHEKDLLAAKLGGKTSIEPLLKKPVFVSEHIKIANLLEVFKKSQAHMAVVLDEFGGMLGIVTMEDVIEELIGDVFDEHDTVVTMVFEEPDGSFLVDASLELDDFLEQFPVQIEDDEDLPQTVNGWLLGEFGVFPSVGDTLSKGAYKIEVTKNDVRKIEQIRVTKTEETPAEAEK